MKRFLPLALLFFVEFDGDFILLRYQSNMDRWKWGVAKWKEVGR